jgi:signal transduction histidine kinase
LNSKRYISLNIKLLVVILIAIIVTLGVYLVSFVLSNTVIDYYYKNPESIKANVDKAYDDLKSYIGDYSLKGADSDGIQKWLLDNDYTYIEIYDNNKVSFDGGWTYNPHIIGSSSRPAAPGKRYVYMSEYVTDRITKDAFKEDVRNRIVSFADGDYYVYINVYKEQHFYRLMLWIRMLLCVSVLIIIVTVYNRKVIKRMIRLSDEVQQVSEGDLDAVIDPTSNDEIGRLALNVDTMRNSIVERLQSEKAAWDANTELITAMSHDIRTPLTSLIGYIDIIESGRWSSEEEVKKYIASCREKAFQLKDLSDKLFQYFLVFGSADTEKEYEIYDAGILLQQILTEHAAELIKYGYNIDFDYNLPDGIKMKADISTLRRLFDNLTANLMKYADKSYHIRISVVLENDYITVRMINNVLSVSKKVESNKIGLKTCEKICMDMGGDFFYKETENIFTVRASLPVYEGYDETEDESEESEEKIAEEGQTEDD